MTPAQRAARLLHAIGLGRVKLVDDTGDVQHLQVSQGTSGMDGTEKLVDKVRRVTEFGFTSSPPVDSDVVVARLAGNRTPGVVVATNHQDSRLKNLQPGDSAVYDQRGAYVWLQDGKMIVDAAGGEVLIRNASKVRVECALLEVTGDVVSRADGARVSLNALRDGYDAHKHPGVASGSASTGLTDHSV